MLYVEMSTKFRTWRKLFVKGSRTHVFSKPLSKTLNLHITYLLNRNLSKYLKFFGFTSFEKKVKKEFLLN